MKSHFRPQRLLLFTSSSLLPSVPSSPSSPHPSSNPPPSSSLTPRSSHPPTSPPPSSYPPAPYPTLHPPLFSQVSAQTQNLMNNSDSEAHTPNSPNTPGSGKLNFSRKSKKSATSASLLRRSRSSIYGGEIGGEEVGGGGEAERRKKEAWNNFKKNPQFSMIENGIINVEEVDKEEMLGVALDLLQKPPRSRKINDLKILKKITESISFFQTTGSETHEQCLKAMTTVFLPKNKTVFELGTVGSTFYVIFQGSVGVWVNIPKLIKEEKNGVFEEKTELVLTEIKILNAGSSFGELALMEKKPRAATIRCREDCVFSVLDKRNFDVILKEIEQKKLYQQVEFFSTMKIFKTWSYNAVKTLYLYTDQRKFNRNQYVYKEGDDYDALYMVKNGEFEHSLLKIYPIATVLTGEAFGEEELLEKCKRKASVRCVSTTGELFMLSRKEFYRRVMSDESSLEWLKKQIEIRKRARNHRLESFLNMEYDHIKSNSKNNLHSLLGDFSKMNEKGSENSFKKGFVAKESTFYNPHADDFKSNSDMEKQKIIPKPVYSKEQEVLGQFERPFRALEKLEKKTKKIENVQDYNIKSILFEGNYSPKQEIYSSFRRYKAFFESKEEPNFKIDTLIKNAKNGYSRKISFYDKNYSILKLKPVLKTQSLSIDLLPTSLKSRVLKVSEGIKTFEKERRESSAKKYNESNGFEKKRISLEDASSSQISKNSDFFFHRHTKTFNDSTNENDNTNRKLKFEMGSNNVEIKEKAKNVKKYTDFFGIFNFSSFAQKKRTFSSISKEESDLLLEKTQEKQIEDKKLDSNSFKNNKGMKDRANNNNNDNNHHNNNKKENNSRSFLKNEFKEILKEQLKEKSSTIVNGKTEKKREYLKYMGNRYNSFGNLNL